MNSISRRLFGFITAGLLAANTLGADAPEDREYAIKAAFLYNFFSYIDWPPAADGNNPTVFTVGIVGKNPFGAALASLQGKMVKGRRIEVRQLEDSSPLTGIHLLFVSASESSRIPQILERARNTSILTVGEASGFIRDGGVINLVPNRNRVQIEINPAAAERAGLTISSQLLKLAQIVRG